MRKYGETLPMFNLDGRCQAVEHRRFGTFACIMDAHDNDEHFFVRHDSPQHSDSAA